MTTQHRLLGVAVAILWGLNFLAIHASLEQFPPFFLVALRFALLAIPTIIFIPWPKVAWYWLLGYGLGFGTLQFFFLYLAMDTGMPTGLASLVLQSSAPFTVILGATLLAERLSRSQLVGIILAVLGLAVVGWQQLGSAALIPFALTLCAGFGWALGNICNRMARPENPLHLTLWISIVPPIPMAIVSLVVEGPTAIAASFTNLGSATGIWALIGLAYTMIAGTIIGGGMWTWLMSRYPASQVAPFSMLVPVVGLSSAWLVLGETLSIVELLGSMIVVIGVLLASGVIRRRRHGRRPSLDQISPPVTSQSTGDT